MLNKLASLWQKYIIRPNRRFAKFLDSLDRVGCAVVNITTHAQLSHHLDKGEQVIYFLSDGVGFIDKLEEDKAKFTQLMNDGRFYELVVSYAELEDAIKGENWPYGGLRVVAGARFGREGQYTFWTFPEGKA